MLEPVGREASDLGRREAQQRHARRELDARLLEGLRSPASELTDADWARLRERMAERSPELRDH